MEFDDPKCIIFQLTLHRNLQAYSVTCSYDTMYPFMILKDCIYGTVYAAPKGVTVIEDVCLSVSLVCPPPPPPPPFYMGRSVRCSASGPERTEEAAPAATIKEGGGGG